MCDSILDTTLVCSGSIQTKMNQSVQGNFLVQFMMPLRENCPKTDGVFSAPYFLAFSQNTGKYGTEKTPYLDTFQAVCRKYFRIICLQKQPPDVFCKKRCFQKIHRKTPVPESLFNKVAGLRTPFLQSTSGPLLLYLARSQNFSKNYHFPRIKR